MKNNANRIDCYNQKFGKLTAIYRHSKTNGGRWKWFCQCDCGKAHVASISDLKNGKITSCGCRRSSGDFARIHGLMNSRSYNSWVSMRSRCRNKNSPDYKNYGGRGISFCARWEFFHNFYDDMGERPNGFSLERIDVNGDYEPSNCKWIPMAEQSKNRRASNNWQFVRPRPKLVNQ